MEFGYEFLNSVHPVRRELPVIRAVNDSILLGSSASFLVDLQVAKVTPSLDVPLYPLEHPFVRVVVDKKQVYFAELLREDYGTIRIE